MLIVEQKISGATVIDLEKELSRMSSEFGIPEKDVINNWRSFVRFAWSKSIFRLDFLNKELGVNYTSLDKFNLYDWKNICKNKQLSENFIREFQDKVDWLYISVYQKLSEDFIREFQYKVNWYRITINQKLSEKFIREFQNKVDWDNISKYQKLSEDFIREFKDKIYWYYISEYQK